MNRTGLGIALVIAAAVGVTFALHPQIDLELSKLFYQPDRVAPWSAAATPMPQLRDLAAWIIMAVAAPAFVALAMKLLLPRRPFLIPGRAVVFLIATLALAPGLLANVILKDQWGRPRPSYVVAFGGTDEFVPWWDPRGECPKNCSFIAGEPSGAFWTLAPAALAPPQWRALAYASAMAFGAGVGVLRMAAGAHFFTDVVFAGVFTFLIIWTVHGLLYRWPGTHMTDQTVEGAIERVAMRVQDSLSRVFARRPAATAGDEERRG
jgi:membrane-associated PAP2 superfamily phosphatase